ncbi:MAG: glycine cleavage system protein GcvH [Armatimonadetes bacterium]|nr:glycine cleavage system protein GcvH [Armatimonadota bacterium]
MFPTDRKYTRDHEWAKRENGRVRIGITAFAAERLSDIVFVELPNVGAEVRAGQAFGAIESVKAASDLYAPVSGRVVEVNQAVVDGPETINQDPHGAAWMVVIEMSAPDEWEQLLDAEAYGALVGAEQT